MGVTAKTLVEDACRKIGVLARGTELSADELMEGLREMKRMLETWSVEQVLIPYRTRESIALPAQQTVTIGPSGDLDTVRPLAISDLELIDTGGLRYRVLPISRTQWIRSHQLAVSARPGHYYFEKGYPLAKINFSSIPYDPTIRLWSYKPIAAWQVDDLDVSGNPSYSGQEIPTSSLTAATLLADIEFDVGYESAIIYNLAVRLAPDYSKPVSTTVEKLAVSTKAAIATANYEIGEMEIPAALRGGMSRYYDINEGP